MHCLVYSVSYLACILITTRTNQVVHGTWYMIDWDLNYTLDLTLGLCLQNPVIIL